MAMTHAAALLAWYDRHRRALPWRAPPGERRRSLPGLAVGDHAAADHGGRGRRLLPPLPRALADGRGAGRGADRRRDGGLGRARLLRPRPQPARLRPARWPSATAALSPTARRACAPCPASAAYTAAAIAAIAFDRPAVGGRRQCRAGDRAPVRHRDAAAGRQARDPARWPPSWCRSERAGDFAQAMMDLGATICTPRKPALRALPAARRPAAARERGIAEELPRRAPRPTSRRGAALAFVLTRRTARSCCASGRPRACSAAWSRCRRAPGARAASTAARRSREAPVPARWRGSTGWCATPSRISSSSSRSPRHRHDRSAGHARARHDWCTVDRHGRAGAADGDAQGDRARGEGLASSWPSWPAIEVAA